jgi:hypothetical protein
MTIHGVLMVISGLAFGLAVVRAGVLPRWTGLTLMAGVVFIAVSSGLPDAAQTASAGVRDSVVHGEVLGEPSAELRAKLAGSEVPILFTPYQSM